VPEESNSSSTPTPTFPEWQPELEAAVREGDPQKLPQRLEAAEAAIFQRQQALVNGPGRQAEQQAIQDAVRTLRVIQKEKLNYPDWDKK
jgi:hypothetical protein